MIGNPPFLYDSETANPIFEYMATWSQVSGPTTVHMGDEHVRELEIDSLEPGLYRFQYTICGGSACLSSSAETTVLVTDSLPKAREAGETDTVCLNSPIQLAAEAPDYAFEQGVWSAYEMNIVGTDTTLTLLPSDIFSDTLNPNAKVDALDEGIYVFRWTIRNGCGTNYDSVIVHVSNHVGPIAADAGEDQCVQTSSTTLNGNDPKGGVGTWSLVSKPATALDPTIVNPADSNSQVTGLEEGDYIFEWMLMGDGACIPTRDSVLITMGFKPVLDTIHNVNLCGTRSVTLKAADPTPYTGVWSQVCGPYVPISHPNDTILELHNLLYDFDYVLRWTVMNGACTAFDDVAVIVAPGNDSVNAGPDIPLCQETSTQLNADPQPGAIWSLVSGPNLPTFSSWTDPKATISNLVMGTYVFTWTNQSSPSCPITQDTAIVVVVPQANAGSDLNFCEAVSTISLTGNPGSTGTWTYTSGPDATTIVTTLSSNKAKTENLNEVGEYVFRYTISAEVDGSTCVSYDTIIVRIEEEPDTAKAGPDQFLCNETSFQMDGNLPSSGNGTWSKLYGPSGGSFDTITKPNAIFSGAVPGLYIFQWTIANGECSNADQVRIENFAEPSIADAGPDQDLICATEITLAGNDPAIGVGKWSLIDKDDATAPDPVITSSIIYNSTVTGLGPKSNDSSATYTFEWRISNGPACEPSVDTMIVTVYALADTAKAGHDQGLCKIFDYTLNANEPSSGQTGTWSVIEKPTGAGNPVFTPNDSTYNAVVAFDTTKYGTYKLKWKIQADYCESEDTVEITIYQEPSLPSVTSDTLDLCQFYNLTLEATVAPSPQIGTGLWTQTEGPTPTLIVNDTALSTPVYGLTDTTYAFTYTVTNGTCTPKSVVQYITINSDPPMAATGPNIVECDLTSLTLNGFFYPDTTHSTDYPPTNYKTGEWTIESSSFGTPTFADSSVYNTTITGLVPGFPNQYTLKWTVANGSCVSSDTLTIKTWAKPSAGVRADIDTCYTDNFMLYTTTPTIGNGVWEKHSGPDGATIVSPSNSVTSVQVTQPGNYVFHWKITNGICTPVYRNVAVKIDSAITVPTPTTNDSIVCIGAQPTLTASPKGGDGNYTYQWQKSDGNCSGNWSNISGAESQSYQTPPLVAGKHYYRVLVSDGKECDTIESGCATIQVYADPIVNITPPVNICAGGSTTFSGTVVEGVPNSFSYQWQYSASWTNVTDDTPTGATYTGATSDILGITTTNSTPPGNYDYHLSVTSSALGCDVATGSTQLIIWDDPIISTHPKDTNLCAGKTHTMSVVASASSALSYRWQVSENGISGWSSVGTNTASYTTAYFTPTGNTVTTRYYRVIITQTESGCETISNSAKVTWRAIPVVNPITATICDSTNVNRSLTSSTTGTTYTWTAAEITSPPVGITGFSDCASSCPTVISQTLDNPGTRPGTVRYTVTPTGPAPTYCVGSPGNINITVNPTPTVSANPTDTLVCSGNPFRINLGTTITGATVRYRWTISVYGSVTGASNSPPNYANSYITQTLNNTSDSAGSVTYTITPYINGTPCSGPPITAKVTVAPRGKVTTISPVTYCHGDLTAEITFNTSIKDGIVTYRWTNSNSNIGLDTAGNTKISSFTAQNLTTAPIFGIIRVTPTNTYTYGGNTVTCTALTPMSFNIYTNPFGQVDSIPDFTVCDGDVTEINFTTNRTGGNTTYMWNHHNSAIGLTTLLGSGNPPIFTATNGGNFPIHSNFTVTPTFESHGKGCAGASRNFKLYVNPEGKMATVPNQRLCHGKYTNEIIFTTPSSGGTTTYTWTNSHPSIGLPASGSGDTIPSFLAINTDSLPVIATISVTPTYSSSDTSCMGGPEDFTITVDPIPIVNSPSNVTICSGDPLDYTFVSTVAGTTYEWTALNTEGTVIGYSDSSGTTITDTLINNGTLPHGKVLYIAQPIGPDTTYCKAPIFYLIVNVLNCNPVVGVAKQLVSTENNQDSTFNATFNIRVHNLGNTPLINIQVTENLVEHFGTGNFEIVELYSTSFDVNTNFNGISDTNLLNNSGTDNSLEVGASTNIVLKLKLRVGSYLNQVAVSAKDPYRGIIVTDLSQNGSDPDPDGDGNPGNNNEHTPVANCAHTLVIVVNQNTQCNSNVGKVTITSSNDAPISIDGGATYHPSPAVFENLYAGYYIAQTSGECNAYEGFNIINQNSSLAATISITEIKCHGDTGSVAVTASGGTAPYTYKLNNSTTNSTGSFTNLSAGNYNILVTDNLDCTYYVHFTLIQPDSLRADFVCPSCIEHVACRGDSTGSATIYATGGTLPYTYSWSHDPMLHNRTATGLAAGTYYVTVIDDNNCTQIDSVIITQPTTVLAIGTTPTLTDPTCHGYEDGKINITVTGGTKPYSYVWSNGMATEDITSVPADTFYVTVTDSLGCTANGGPYILNNPPEITITASNITHTECNGAHGSVVLTSSPSSVNITLNDSTKASGSTFYNLPAGYYTSYTASGCPASVSFSINNTDSDLAATISTTDVKCYGNNNGTATLNINGGITPYSMNVNGGTAVAITGNTHTLTGLTPGNYNVIITDDHGCTFHLAFDIDQPTPLVVDMINVIDSNCHDTHSGMATVIATGGMPPYSYLWSSGGQTQPTAIYLSPGTHFVTVTDANGCSRVDTVTIGTGSYEAPIIVCPDNFLVYTATDACTWTSSANQLHPSLIVDFCDIHTLSYTLSGATTGSGSGNIPSTTFNLGVTTATYTLTYDTNSTSCSFTITVKDNVAPVLTCVADKIAVTDTNKCDFTYSPNITNVLVSDNCSDYDSLNITYRVFNPDHSLTDWRADSTVYNFEVGISLVEYRVIDKSGNETRCI